MHVQIKRIFSGAITFLLFFCVGCEQDKVPTVFDPDDTGEPAPVITHVEPEDYALVALSEITISGENFSASMDSVNGNTVYIGNEKADVLSASGTEITVKATPTPGDSMTIKVIVPGAYQIAEYTPYQLRNIKEGVGKKGTSDDYYAIAVDNEENIYAFIRQSSSGVVHRFLADGSSVEIGTVPIPLLTDMKVGPNGYLYMLYGYDTFYRLNIDEGTTEEFMKLPERVGFFDFDQNHNIYAAGNKKGMVVTDTDGSEAKKVGDFDDFVVYSLKVYDGAVYIAAAYSGSNASFPERGIFKADITSSGGDLGETVPVFNWDNAEDHAASAMKSLTIDENGTMLVGTNNIDNPIVTIEQDGSVHVLYPGILLFSVSQIVYGTGEYVYQNRRTSDLETFTIYKILTESKGAPYYGRE